MDDGDFEVGDDFLIGDVLVGKNSPIFFIAEIGQNHQGSLEIAKQLIYEAKIAGCDCVKLQKSCLPEKFTKSACDRIYNTKNSWGKTYGDHKRFLEFSDEDFYELKAFAKKLNIMFSASAMDEVSLMKLKKMELPFIKIGSGDANNFLLLSIAATFNCPLIISTGMQSMSTISKIVEIMKNSNKRNYALLHCVSSYPTKPEYCYLKIIELLRNQFPKVVIGYSGHEIGIKISEAAALLGAKIIERHITLNVEQKGSDHQCSITPSQFGQLVTRVRQLEKQEVLLKSLNTDEILEILENNDDVKKALTPITERVILNCEQECKQKLGKSLVCSKNIKQGHILQRSDIKIKVSDPSGIPAEFLENYLGKKMKCDVSYDFPLQIEYFIDL